MHTKNIAINIEKMRSEVRGLVVLATPRLNDESISSFVRGVGDFFSIRINKVGIALGFFGSNNKKGNITQFDDTSAFLRELVKERKAVAKAAEASYGVYEKMRIPTVPGLCTNIVDATDKTIEMLGKINSFLEPKLNDLDTLISKVLSDEAFRTATRPIIHDKENVNRINDLQKTINTFISTKKLEDTVLLGEIVPNMRSILDCYEKLLQTINHGTLDQFKLYKSLIDTITEKINFLVEETKRRPDMLVSKVVLKELSQETEEVAELVTISMNVFWLFNQISGVLRNIAKGVK